MSANLAIAILALVAADPPIDVRAGDLARRNDLLGKTIRVDGRSPKFEYDNRGGWATFRFPPSPVKFRLPPRLTPAAPPRAEVVRVTGTFRHEGGGLVCDVTGMELLPSDLDRLTRAVALLGPTDRRGREAWANWGESRAEEYQDEPLRQKAREILGEAIRIEADEAASIGQPARQRELAERARRRGVPEPEPSALAHRALRMMLPTADSATKAEDLAQKALVLIPSGARTATGADLSAWEDAYSRDPAAAYRSADPAVRAALDRRLVADIVQKALELRASETPSDRFRLAERAERELPDRPEVARQLLERGLEDSDVGALRLAEVQERARMFEKMGQGDRAKVLLRRWLDEQRARRLSPTDAEGRVLLAGQYEELLGDTEKADALLREAWAIDPGAQSTSEAFLRRGYQKVKDEWVAPPNRVAKAPISPPPAPEVKPDQYQGLTRQDVQDQLGKPDRVVRVATSGQVREQWHYTRQGGTLYINFLLSPERARATVISSHLIR